jgi:very-short-patch-repair endonuclease
MTPEQRKQIRQSYKHWTPRSDPYSFGFWDEIFSPIEKLVWHDIRSVGIPMYPQYPVLGYFLDFADPIIKLGIEVDGKDFHTDKEKDLKRQSEIEREGWTIVRINGDKTKRGSRSSFISESDEMEMDSDEVENKLIEYYANTSEGMIRAIKKNFYGKM